MKKGTKIAVFIAAMGLTLGSLIAFVGPRHCGYGMRHHQACSGQHDHQGDGEQWRKDGVTDPNTK